MPALLLCVLLAAMSPEPSAAPQATDLEAKTKAWHERRLKSLGLNR